MKTTISSVQKAGTRAVKAAVRKTIKKTKYVADGVKQDFNTGVSVISEDVTTLGKNAMRKVTTPLRSRKK